MRLQAVWTHCVKIGPERRTSQTSRPIRGLHLNQEPHSSRSMRTELGISNTNLVYQNGATHNPAILTPF